MTRSIKARRLPEMSSMEEAMHLNSAGVTASREAAALGDDPIAAEVLADGTLEPQEAAGWKLYPLTMGTFLAQAECDKRLTEWRSKNAATTEMEAGQLKAALESMACADPRRLLDMVRKEFDLAIWEANRLIWDVPYIDRKPMIDHMVHNMALFASLTGQDDSPASADSPREDGGPGAEPGKK